VQQASLLFYSDRSVQKRKLACRTLYIWCALSTEKYGNFNSQSVSLTFMKKKQELSISVESIASYTKWNGFELVYCSDITISPFLRFKGKRLLQTTFLTDHLL
jgi:hypothetical protein